MIARIVLAAALGLLALPALAEGPREARGGAMGQFDFYVLALSWSPGFCETSGSRSAQCESGSGMGFVTHGLWPQNSDSYPTYCEPSGRFVPRAALADAKGLYPDENLAGYQWRKHGTCTGESPSGYFRAVQRARERVQVPDSLRKVAGDAKVMPDEIERAFMAANPGLRPDMMSVACGRRILQEVRICFDRDLRGFRSCPQVDRDTCRAGEIRIPAVR